MVGATPLGVVTAAVVGVVATNSKRGKMKFLPLLCIAFIVLKLCSVITWSWLLVLLPLYGPAALVIGIWLLGVLGLVGVAGAASALDKILSRKKSK